MNQIGELGEALFTVIISRETSRGFLFRPKFLGDKWPVSDAYVELIHWDGTMRYFFCQIKTTTQGYTQRERKLKIQVPKEKLIKLANYPAPTYVIGVDVHSETGYIQAVTSSPSKGISSLSTNYPLNNENLNRLYDEVNDFWDNLEANRFKTNFVSNFVTRASSS